MVNNLPRLVIGIFGATGLVGEELEMLLKARKIPANRIRRFGGDRKEKPTRGVVPVAGARQDGGSIESFERDASPQLDLAFLAAPPEASRDLAPRLVESGCLVVDCSSAHRDDVAVPLVVPEINGDRLATNPRLVASPNCTTTLALMAIEPIRRVAGLRRISLCSYQAVSGAGRRGLAELDRQIAEAAAGGVPTAGHFPSPILCNLFCHESAEDEFGENDEERKIRDESRRILDLPDLPVAATCVRVATRRAHAIAISIETERDTTRPELHAALDAATGLRLVPGDARSDDLGPSPRLEPIAAEGRDEVLVGRLRPDRSGPGGRAWSLFVVGDQLRKGAALNAIQIAEAMAAAGIH